MNHWGGLHPTRLSSVMKVNSGQILRRGCASDGVCWPWSLTCTETGSSMGDWVSDSISELEWWNEPYLAGTPGLWCFIASQKRA